MVEDREPLPDLDAVSLDDLRASGDLDPETGRAILAHVPVDLPGKIRRVNITLDERLIEAIDQRAQASGETRSGFIAAAARARLSG